MLFISKILERLNYTDRNEEDIIKNFLLEKKLTNNLIAHAKKLNSSYTHTYTTLEITKISIHPDDNHLHREKISHLDLAVIYGELHHVHAVNSILSTEDDSSNIRVAAFYRALEHKKIDAANFLLDFQEVKDASERLNIFKRSYKDAKTFQSNIIDRFKHIIVNNRVDYSGNLALLLAAKTGDALIFNRLLQNNTIQSQLKNTGIVALINMTRTNDGKPVDLDKINIQILSQILDIPEVYQYANQRKHDFQYLLDAKQEFADSIDDSQSMTTNPSFSSISTISEGPSSRTTTPSLSSDRSANTSPRPYSPFSFIFCTNQEEEEDSEEEYDRLHKILTGNS